MPGICSLCIRSLGFFCLFTNDQYLLIFSPLLTHWACALLLILALCLFSRCLSSLCRRDSVCLSLASSSMDPLLDVALMSLFRALILLSILAAVDWAVFLTILVDLSLNCFHSLWIFCVSDCLCMSTSMSFSSFNPNLLIMLISCSLFIR